MNDYQFTSASSAATVVAGAETKMKITGWKLISTSTKQPGPLVTPLGTAPQGSTT